MAQDIRGSIQIKDTSIPLSKLEKNVLSVDSGNSYWDAQNKVIKNVGTPTSDNDAATKAYVDSIAQGLDPKQSVRAATTQNITLSGTQTVDGVSLNVGDRVLVKDQTSAVQNGIYVVASGTWSRASDADTWDELVSAYVFVEEGTVNGDLGFVCTINAGGTLGSDPITWVQFTGAGQITAGDGLKKTGNTLSIDLQKEAFTVQNNGDRNFTLSYTPVTNSTLVFYNGLLQREGSSYDYVVSGNQIQFQYDLVAGDSVIVQYFVAG